MLLDYNSQSVFISITNGMEQWDCRPTSGVQMFSLVSFRDMCSNQVEQGYFQISYRALSNLQVIPGTVYMPQQITKDCSGIWEDTNDGDWGWVERGQLEQQRTHQRRWRLTDETAMKRNISPGNSNCTAPQEESGWHPQIRYISIYTMKQPLYIQAGWREGASSLTT